MGPASTISKSIQAGLAEAKAYLNDPALISPSRYNVLIPETSSTPQLLFNCMTQSLTEIEAGEAKLVDFLIGHTNAKRVLADLQIEALEYLLDNGFITHSSRDEYSEFLLHHEMTRYNADNSWVTIMPTERCNFRCPYCFLDPDNSDMSEETIQKTRDFIEELSREKSSLYVTWYGGEPLLRFDIIERLSADLIRLNENYTATMISNGYLLTEEIARKCKDLKIIKVQVTIDGPREYNNRRRIHESGAPTFDTILANAVMASNYMQVSVRVNLDPAMGQDVEGMASFMDDVYRKSKGRVSAYLAPVYEVENCPGSVMYGDFDWQVFVESFESIYRAVLEEIPQYSFPWISRRYISCGAIGPDTCLVNPKGEVYQCWEDPTGRGDGPSGNVLREWRTYEECAQLTKYLTWDEVRKSDCSSCSLLPACAGRCPKKVISAGEDGKVKEACKFTAHWIPLVCRLTYLQKKKLGEQYPYS